MKRNLLSLIAIALVCLSLSGCLTLKPFSQQELDQLSGIPASAGN